MQISEVRVKLIPNPTDRLKAFCSITLDGDFVIRDIKLIEGGAGVFVAMPSRKLSDHCPKCNAKNHLRASYCNECSAPLGKDRVRRDKAGRRKLHADIAHPINSTCRQDLQTRIVEAFERELAASKQPGYQPMVLDDDDDYLGDDETAATGSVQAPERTAGRDFDDDGRDDEIRRSEMVPDDDGAEDLEEDDGDGAETGTYQEMIADLKRDAAQRREAHNERRAFAFGEPAETNDEPDAVAANDADVFGFGLADPDIDESDADTAPESVAVSPEDEVLNASPVEAAGPSRESESDADDFGSGIL